MKLTKLIITAALMTSVATVAQMPSRLTYGEIGNAVATIFEDSLFYPYDDIVIGDYAYIKKNNIEKTHTKIGQVKPNGPMKYVFIKKGAQFQVKDNALKRAPVESYIRIIGPDEKPIYGEEILLADFIKNGKKYRIFYKSQR
jgi:hypothetical protein